MLVHHLILSSDARVLSVTAFLKLQSTFVGFSVYQLCERLFHNLKLSVYVDWLLRHRNLLLDLILDRNLLARIFEQIKRQLHAVKLLLEIFQLSQAFGQIRLNSVDYVIDVLSVLFLFFDDQRPPSAELILEASHVLFGFFQGAHMATDIFDFLLELFESLGEVTHFKL